MQNSKGSVALIDRTDGNSESVNIQDLREAQMLTAHFVINAKEGFFTTLQIDLNPSLGKLHPHRIQNLVNHLTTITTRLLNRFLNRPKTHRHGMLKADVL